MAIQTSEKYCQCGFKALRGFKRQIIQDFFLSKYTGRNDVTVESLLLELPTRGIKNLAS